MGIGKGNGKKKLCVKTEKKMTRKKEKENISDTFHQL